MTFLVIILALGLILSPLLALQPSARERQQQRLRAHAMRRGLQVQYPQHKAPSDGARTISYRLPVPRERNIDVMLAIPVVLERINSEVDDLSEWRASGASPVAASYLEQFSALLKVLPRDVFQVTLAARRLSAEWCERGDEKAVDQIADLLETMLEKLDSAAAQAAPESTDHEPDP